MCVKDLMCSQIIIHFVSCTTSYTVDTTNYIKRNTSHLFSLTNTFYVTHYETKHERKPVKVSPVVTHSTLNVTL